MKEYILQTLMAALGSLGFAALFNVHGKRMILFFLGGALDWAVYLLCVHNGLNTFIGLFLATSTAAFISEILARVIHTPVLILLVPMLIPLIPGGSLYYSMDALIRGEKDNFLTHGSAAVTSAGAICLGIICVTTITHIIFAIIDHIKSNKKISN